MNYAIVRTDKMIGTDVRSELASVRYAPDDIKTAIENGNVVLLNGLEDNSREIYKGVMPEAGSALKDIVLIASPEIMYDDHKYNLANFRNEAGDICRGYYLHENDIFSVTKEALDGAEAPAVGNIVELKAGTKLNVVESLSPNATKVGKIIEVNTVGKVVFYVIQVG